MEHILSNIKAIRLKKGYSQENMAESLKITQGNYHRIESGTTKLTLERLYQIADLLETSPAQLMNIYVLNKKDYEDRLDDSYEKIKSLKKEIESLNKELKFVRYGLRGMHLFLRKIYKVFITPGIADRKDVTIADLDKAWNDNRESFNLSDPKSYIEYSFNNPKYFGFSQDSIGQALSVSVSEYSEYISKLNKNPDMFGFYEKLKE